MNKIVGVRNSAIRTYSAVLFFNIVLYYILPERSNSIIILLLSILNIFIFSWLAYHELKTTKDFNPIIFLLVTAIIYVGYNGLNLYLELINGNSVEFGIYNITRSLPKGMIFVCLEHLLMLWGYYRILNTKGEDNRPLIIEIFKTKVNYLSLGYKCYVTVICIRFVNIFIPLVYISSIFDIIMNQGQLVALILLLFSYYTTDNKLTYRIHWGIVVVEMLLAISTGMKEAMLLPLLPFIVFLLLKVKQKGRFLNLGFIIRCCVIGAFIVLCVFPYVSLYRQINWSEHKDMSSMGVFCEYVQYMQGEGVYYEKSKNRSSDYVAERAGSIASNTFSIMYADKFNNLPSYFYVCASAVIPRVLWPSKPAIPIGVMSHSLAMGDSDWINLSDTRGTSYTLGFIGSCYLSFGVLFALIAPFFMGIILGRFWLFYRARFLKNPVAMFGVFGIIVVMCQDCEAFVDGGLIFTVWNMFYCCLIKMIEGK